MGSNQQPKQSPNDLEAMRAMTLQPVAFNVMGIAPSACIYRVEVERTIEFMTQVCRDIFGAKEIHSVDVKSNYSNGIVNMYVWFRWDSQHLIDKTLIDDQNAFVHRPVPRWSDQLKQFMAAYCREENRRVFSEGDGRNERSYKAVKVDIYKVFCAMFDQKGRWYNEAFSEKSGRKAIPCRLDVQAIWDEKSRRLQAFEVRKCDNRGDSRMPIEPISAFKARD